MFKKNINKPYIYTDATLNLVYFNIVKVFILLCLKWKTFKNTASSEDLIATVDKAMEKLQNSSNVNLDSFKSKITNSEELEKLP